jgi:hypothetical protein
MDFVYYRFERILPVSSVLLLLWKVRVVSGCRNSRYSVGWGFEHGCTKLQPMSWFGGQK